MGVVITRVFRRTVGEVVPRADSIPGALAGDGKPRSLEEKKVAFVPWFGCPAILCSVRGDLAYWAVLEKDAAGKQGDGRGKSREQESDELHGSRRERRYRVGSVEVRAERTIERTALTLRST